LSSSEIAFSDGTGKGAMADLERPCPLVKDSYATDTELIPAQ